MAYLHELNSVTYEELLAADRPAVPDPEATGTIPANQWDRTLLIGLGGTGVKVLDQIKQQMQSYCAPGHHHQVQYLAVDTDPTELENANFLTPDEKVCLTRPGMCTMQHGDPAAWPPAWHQIVDPEAIHTLPSLDIPGAGANRLVGKLKLYFQAPGQPGNDMRICQKLEAAIHQFPPDPAGCYRVYVIGSLYGGTGSGCFLEMPALIRSVFPPYLTVEIHAILLTADAMLRQAPQPQQAQFQANCYAALKELDYYQGLATREGYGEDFPSNDPANPRRTLDCTQRLFGYIHLVGSRSYYAKNLASIQAFLLPWLIDSHPIIGPGFTAPAPEQSDFLPHYSAIGTARAEVPADIVKAYMYGNALDRAGLLTNPVYQPAAAGHALYRELLDPLMHTIQQALNPPRFDYCDVFGGIPTLEEFHDGTADSPARRAQIAHFIDLHTNAGAHQQMREAVQKAYAAFRESVKAFVAEKGPLAFDHLFGGYFTCADGELPLGIERRLEYLCNGNDVNGRPIPFPLAESIQVNLYALHSEILGHAPGFMALLHQNYLEERENWVRYLEKLVAARITNQRRGMLLGVNGILAQEFLAPAMTLAKQIHAFGKVLQVQTDYYLHHGKALENYRGFKDCAEYLTVNLGAVSAAAFEATAIPVRRHVDQIDPRRLREALVNDFFENPDPWLYVAHALTVPDGHGVLLLRDSRRPIAARHALERAMRRAIPPLSQFSMAQMFQEMSNTGVSAQEYADMILAELSHAAQPVTSAYLPHRDVLYLLTYPGEIFRNHVPISDALQQAARRRLGQNVYFFFSGDTDAITLQEVTVPMDISRIVDARPWEQAYLARLTQPGTGLHGISPDGGHTPWADYPAITRCDPDAPQPHHTAAVRHRIDDIIHKARRQGVLYAEQLSGGGYVIRFIRLARRGIDWHFDPTCLALNPDNGLLPDGTALLRQIVEQNGRNPWTLLNTVDLRFPGITFMPQPSEEDAWEYAHRVLYAHRPMLRDIQDTLELTTPWFQTMAECFAEQMRRMRPKKFFRMILVQMLVPGENGLWLFRDDNGLETPFAHLERLKHDPDWADALEHGLTLFVLYERLMKHLGEEAFEEAAERARALQRHSCVLDDLKETAKWLTPMAKEEQHTIRTMHPLQLRGLPMGEQIRAFYESLPD